MNFAQFLRSLISRPLALGLVAIVAIAAGVAGWRTSSPVYESTAVAVVIPPGSGNPDAMMNPLIRLDDDVAQLAAVVATALRINGGEVSRSAGGSGDFTVDTTFGDSARSARITSQIVIVASGRDPASAQRGAAALLELSRSALARMQAGLLAQPNNGASILTTVDPQPGVAVATSPLRRALSYGFATVAAGVVLLLLLEAMTQLLRKALADSSRGRRRSHNGTVPGVDSELIPPSDPQTAFDHQTISAVRNGRPR